MFYMTIKMSFKLHEFVILLKSIPEDEVQDIVLWTECDKVADINDVQLDSQLDKEPSNSQPLPATNSGPSVIASTCHVPTNASKVVRFDFRQDPRTKRHLDNLTLLNDELHDLVPPDIDTIDFDRMFQSINNDDSDSVSWASSSDASFHTCIEDNHVVDSGPKIELNSVRPGIKLDDTIFKPLSREDALALPTMPLFKCKKPRCGFTTSNPLTIRYHTHTDLSEQMSIEQVSFEHERSHVT